MEETESTDDTQLSCTSTMQSTNIKLNTHPITKVLNSHYYIIFFAFIILIAIDLPHINQGGCRVFSKIL